MESSTQSIVTADIRLHTDNFVSLTFPLATITYVIVSTTCSAEILFLIASVLISPICLNCCFIYVQTPTGPPAYQLSWWKLADYPVSLTYMETDVTLQLLRFPLHKWSRLHLRTRLSNTDSTDSPRSRNHFVVVASLSYLTTWAQDCILPIVPF